MRQKVDSLSPKLQKLNVPSGSSDSKSKKDTKHDEDIRQRIERVQADLKDLAIFYNITISPLRTARLKKYYNSEIASLRATDFSSYDQQGKIDFLLLQNNLKRSLRQLDLDAEKDRKMEPVLPFAAILVKLCEERQQMNVMDAQKAAGDVNLATKQIEEVSKKIFDGKVTMEKTIAHRAVNAVELLRSRMEEWFAFYRGYGE